MSFRISITAVFLIVICNTALAINYEPIRRNSAETSLVKNIPEPNDLYSLDSCISENYIGHFTYRSDNLLDSLVYWRNDSVRNNTNGYAFKYNDQEQIIEQSNFIWNDTLQKWGFSTRYVYDYDSIGNEILYSVFEWSESRSNWLETSRRIRQFDKYGNRIYSDNYYLSYNDTDTIFKGTQKYIKEFDSLGNPLVQEYYDWDNDLNKYTFTKKLVKTYSTSQILSDTYYANYDTISDEFLYIETQLFEYHNQILLKDSSFIWNNIENEWSISKKCEFYYLDTLLIADSTFESIDNNNWQINIVNTYNYNINNLLYSRQSSHWNYDSIKLLPSSNDTIYYNQFGDDTLKISTYWYYYNGGLIYKSRHRKKYNQNRNLLFQNRWEWDDVTQDTLNGEIIYFDYDDYGNEYHKEIYYWNSDQQQLVGSYNTKIFYDSSGNNLGYESYQWDEDNKTWLGNYKYMIELDYNVPNEHTNAPKIWFSKSHKTDRRVSYNWINNQWDYWYSYKYYYTKKSNSFNSIEVAKCGTYKSPSGKVFTLSGTYTDTIPNAIGRDSIITINLSVEHINNDIMLMDGILFAVEENASYQWLNCLKDEEIEGVTDQSYSPIKDGEYAVKIKSGECVDTSECVAFVRTSTINNSDSGTRLYPNPASETIMVMEISSQAVIRINNTEGRVVLEQSVANHQQISIAELEPGIYFYQVFGADNTESGKLLIHR